MQDSMDLAKAIVNFGVERLDEAVAEYEAIMLPRGRALIERSAAAQGTMCGPHAAEEMRKMFEGMEKSVANGASP